MRDLGGEPVADRCRRCYKPMCVDVGAGLHGQHEVLLYCLNCGHQPEEADWTAQLTAAVATVRSRATA